MKWLNIMWNTLVFRLGECVKLFTKVKAKIKCDTYTYYGIYGTNYILFPILGIKKWKF